MRPQHKENINSPCSRRPLLWLAGLILPMAAMFTRQNRRYIPLGLVFLSHMTVLAALLWPNARLLHNPVRRFKAEGREVWLTLDDGPDPVTTPVLARALADRGVCATFFLVGNQVQPGSAIVRELEEAGHEVANHTQTHPRAFFWALPRGVLVRQIRECSQRLRAAGAQRLRCFRAPVGMANTNLGPALDDCGLRAIGWSVRAYDGATCDPDAVISRVVNAAEPGAIILMHEGKYNQQGDAVSLPVTLAVVDILLKRGFRFVIPEADRWI